MSGDELTGAKENPTAPEAAEGDASSSAPVDFPIIDLEPFGKVLERSRAAGQAAGPRRPPTARVGKVDDKSDAYDLAGDAVEIPAVFSTQNLSRSVPSTPATTAAKSTAAKSSAAKSPSAMSPAAKASALRASLDEADKMAQLKKKALMLAVAVALLAITNAITAYKLFSRSGQGSAVPLAQAGDASDDSTGPAPGARPGGAHANAGPPDAAPEPALPPATAAPVAAVQDWDAARFAKAKVVEAKCSFSGKQFVFRTPGCTSFVMFPPEAFPDSLVQAQGESPDVFRITRAKGGDEPLVDCTMHGGTNIQVRIGKKSGSEEDLLRHSATILAVAKHGDEEILYVCEVVCNFSCDDCLGRKARSSPCRHRSCR